MPISKTVCEVFVADTSAEYEWCKDRITGPPVTPSGATITSDDQALTVTVEYEMGPWSVI